MKICKNEEEITKTISYRLKFIDNARFMANSLSSLVNKYNTEYKCLCCNKNCQKKLMKIQKRNLPLHINLLMMISISFIHCFGKVFTHMNIWMTGENSTKYHNQKKKIFTLT